MKKVLAFDFGASSGRAILGIFEGNKIKLEEIHRFSNDPVEVNGHLYWDVLRLFFEIKQGILKCANEGHKDISAIGIDTWGVDSALIDSDGEMLANPYHYRDFKVENMQATFDEIGKQKIYDETGLQMMSFNTLYQLRYLKTHKPELLKRAKRLLLMPDLFNYLLTGKMAAEYSNASTTALLNPRTGDWSTVLLKELGIDRALMGDIVDPGTILGVLKAELAEELMMPQVPVICVASHDTGSAVASVPFINAEESLYISCGTWSLMGAELNAPVINDEAFALNLTNEGGVNRTTRFLKNIMGTWLIQESRRQWLREGQQASFAELEQAAKAAKPFVSYMNPDEDVFSPPGNMPRRIKEYCKNSGQIVPETQGEIMRCIYQSLAFTYRNTVESIEKILNRKITTIHMVGGGIKDKLLCKMTAEATGRRVLAGPVEATAMGNIVVQLIALGEISDITQAREYIKNSFAGEEYLPSSEVAEWDKAYEQFKKIIEVKL